MMATSAFKPGMAASNSKPSWAVRPHVLKLGRRQLPGFCRMASADADLADVMERRAEADDVALLQRQAQLVGEQHGIVGDALGMVAGILDRGFRGPEPERDCL